MNFRETAQSIIDHGKGILCSIFNPIVEFGRKKTAEFKKLGLVGPLLVTTSGMAVQASEHVARGDYYGAVVPAGIAAYGYYHIFKHGKSLDTNTKTNSEDQPPPAPS